MSTVAAVVVTPASFPAATKCCEHEPAQRSVAWRRENQFTAFKQPAATFRARRHRAPAIVPFVNLTTDALAAPSERDERMTKRASQPRTMAAPLQTAVPATAAAAVAVVLAAPSATVANFTSALPRWRCSQSSSASAGRGARPGRRRRCRLGLSRRLESAPAWSQAAKYAHIAHFDPRRRRPAVEISKSRNHDFNLFPLRSAPEKHTGGTFRARRRRLAAFGSPLTRRPWACFQDSPEIDELSRE